MMNRLKSAFLVAACVPGLAACATNYAGEGALGGAAVGAAAGLLTGGNVVRGAAVGAAVGGVAGTLIRKDGKCSRYDDDGREFLVRCPN
jgi:hypothetical protein